MADHQKNTFQIKLETGDVLQVTAEGKTDIGQVRSTNQDAFLIHPSKPLYIVADGMGGHAGGEIASQLCLEKVCQYLDEHDFYHHSAQHPQQQLGFILADAVNFASAQIYEKALEDPALKGMGTTVSLIYIAGLYAYYAHVGDSRIYLWRQGFLYQMTYDHSLVSEQVRAGLISPEEAELHHLRNVITRSVGYQEAEDVDTGYFLLENEDLLLICSDGLHGKVSNQQIAALLKENGIYSSNQLVKLANAQGGDDNITAILIKIQVLS